jgi:PAS domain S-box-containing protein
MTETRIRSNRAGQSVLFGYAPIKSSLGRSDGILVIELDATSMTQSAVHAFMVAGIIFLVVLLISLPLVWWLGQSLVVQPTLQLNQVARRLADGQWDETLPTDRADELGQLARSFNYMALQLKTSFHQLQDYSLNLELKVEERTQKLKESEQLLNLVMNNIPQSIFWKNRDNVYLGCNQSFAQAADKAVAEIVGKTDYDMPWAETEADFYIECDRKVMQSGQPLLKIVEPILKGNGQQGWLETSKVPLYDVQGEVMGIIGIFQDITPYKEAEAAAHQANEAKSEFLANMSHELRTPLNGILGYAQILQRSKTLGEKEQNQVEIIDQCGNHLLTLINDILDLAKIEARKLELSLAALHLPSLLQSVVEMCKIKAEQKKIDFLYQPSSRLPTGVITDEKRLRQVLINLLGNAIKFTEAGTVTLLIDVLHQSEDQATLVFQVMDTGIGIAPEHLSRLFQAFEQVGDRTKQAEGTGLGLAISQRILELMGSQIEVQSQPGQGSEFSFVVGFSLTDDWAEQQQDNHHAYILGYQGEPRTILVIDDRWENRTVLQNLLEPIGFQIILAADGKIGLEKLRSGQPDLVITDLLMPVMDGYEFLKAVRGDDQLHHTTIIVSSASVSQADQQLAITQGGDDFLPKPIDTQLLFQLLATHLSLTWVYDASSVPPPIPPGGSPEPVATPNVPSRQILESLFKAARCGNIRSLRQQLETLIDSSENYQAFGEPLLQLSKQFALEEIEAILQTYLTGDGELLDRKREERGVLCSTVDDDQSSRKPV